MKIVAIGGPADRKEIEVTSAPPEKIFWDHSPPPLPSASPHEIYEPTRVAVYRLMYVFEEDE